MSFPASSDGGGSVASANAALGGEHAAIYAYGVIGARLGRTEQPLAAAGVSRHRGRRDALAVMIAKAGAAPTPAEAAYTLPFPVRNRAHALQLAVLVEGRLSALYLRLVVDASDQRLRAVAVGALQAAAADAAIWRVRAGITPTTVAFPGR